MKSTEISTGNSPLNNESSAPQSDTAIPAAVPAAVPVERGRFVLQLHNRDEDSDDDVASENDDDGDNNNNNDGNDNNNNNTAPDSPKSFNSEEIFEDVEQGKEQVSDRDLERLLGPLPLRRVSNNASGDNNKNMNSLEVDNNASDDSRWKRSKKAFCPCCPGAVRRGPWQMIMAMTGHDGSTPGTRVGNMIVVFPRCFYNQGFGIMGPHWFGPVCCLGLLTFATIYFAPKAYHNVGPISAITCLIFYITAVVSLCVVSCSDPGVVKSGTGSDGRDGGKGYAGIPTTGDVSAGRGWRYCDLCSVYQPPDAVHCPECNVCVEGYDHHCPWMGTCIGKKNFTSFMAFNCTWLFYLLYSIFWVTFFGAAFNSMEPDSDDDM